jgi:peptide/nickel transport system permease protein
MKVFIIRRLLYSIPLLIAMSFVTFMFIQLAPGSYFDTLKLDPLISPETIKKYEEEFHLDQPAIVQYGYWLSRILRLDFGYSFEHKRRVIELLIPRAKNTLILSLSAILFTWMIALPIGIYSAVHQYSWGDKFFAFLAFFGMSIPNFFFALLLLYLAYLSGLLPIGGMVSANYYNLNILGKALDLLKHLAIPTVVIGTGSMAGLQRIMRGNMLEVLRADYVTTARSKGLPENRVIYRHALRNAINPMITIFGYELSALLSGAALTEIIVSWPGLGSLLLSAVRSQDLFLIMAGMMMGGFMLIVGNLMADILLAWSDPRVQFSHLEA